jgi:uncharacterized membrane protein YfcA
LHTRISSHVLAVVFGGLLILAGVSELTGWIESVRWGRRAAWVTGALSGALGTRLLARLPQRVFHRVIAVLLLALGLYMAFAGSD